MSAELAYVMNDSLTPTKMNSKKPISPSNYPDKKSMVNAYKRMVHQVLDSPEDQAKLQKVLKEFHRTLVVEDLMEQLKPILNSPQRRKLYLAIRPLVPSRVRGEYNSLIPHVPSFEKKVVHLKQAGSRSMGFKIRGGKEFKCGIYVSAVQPSSKASQAGLKIGDEVVRINGLILSESTHEEVVNIMALKKSLTLNVRCVGMIPEQDVAGNLGWKTVEEKKPRMVNPVRKLNNAILRSTKKIQITLNEGETLGASIKSLHDKSTGVFITELVPNSIAYEQGLKIGDELIEVNGESLVNVPHRQAVAMLKSSNSLMLTIRNKDPTVVSHLANYDPLSNPPEDFEMNPHDIDMDAELIPTDLNASYGFVLRTKDGQERRSAAVDQMRRSGGEIPQRTKRLSLTNMDTEHSNKNAPTIASPAAFGFGPSVALPTLLGMMPQVTNLDDETEEEEEEDETDGDVLAKYLKGLSPTQAAAVRESMALPDLSSNGQEVLLNPSYFASPKKQMNKQQQEQKQQKQQQQQQQQELQHEQDLKKQQELQQQQLQLQQQQLQLQQQQIELQKKQEEQQQQLEEQRKSREGSKISGADLASYQFPVEDEAAAESKENKKNLMKRKKTPYFQERVEIIETRESLSSNSETFDQPVHPSNMEFSDKVLKGRKVAFHTIPKNGPIKIAIRGGTDTPLGGAIFISRILEGGAAARYGKLNVGDQILVCDGVNLIDVTHDEAAQALKRAMDMDSRSIDIVVAVDAGNQTEDKL